MKRGLGLLSFFGAAVWSAVWFALSHDGPEALRAYLYENAFQAWDLIGVDKLLQYGVPALLVLVGLTLFYYSRPRTVQMPMNVEPATAASENKEEVTEEEISLREAATQANE